MSSKSENLVVIQIWIATFRARFRVPLTLCLALNTTLLKKHGKFQKLCLLDKNLIEGSQIIIKHKILNSTRNGNYVVHGRHVIEVS